MKKFQTAANKKKKEKTKLKSEKDNLLGTILSSVEAVIQ